MIQPLTQHDVEGMLMNLSDALADATDEYRSLCDAAVQADLDYKHAFHSAVVRLSQGPKVTADVRRSMAFLAAEQEERAAATIEAAKDAAKAGLRTITTRVEALRTISANVRNQT